MSDLKRKPCVLCGKRTTRRNSKRHEGQWKEYHLCTDCSVEDFKQKGALVQVYEDKEFPETKNS